MKNIVKNYEIAKEIYAEYGIDTDKVLNKLQGISVSMQCWQGDDGLGFECKENSVNTGIMATGNYLGRATNADQLRQDAEKAFSMIPGTHKFNLHSIYAETNGKKVERNQLEYKYFEGWVDWAKSLDIGIDFNPTLYNHEMMVNGYSLSSPDKNVRDFWIEHVKRCREIANKIAINLNKKCVNNIWISDGSKDTSVCKYDLRANLKNSLDEILSVKYDKKNLVDAVESKLFGIGTESFVVGSLEFYLSYALKNDMMFCFDMGHYHPTEKVSEKLSAIFHYMDSILLHVSRGVRWDSDHVVIYDDDTKAIFEEINRANAFDKVNVATDFFDASINRVGAWVIGMRNTVKSMLYALLEPVSKLKEMEFKADYTARLGLLEELKTLPFGFVWDYFCYKNNVPLENEYMNEIKDYEKKVLVNR